MTFANLLGATLCPLVIENTPPAGSTSGGSMQTKPVQPLTAPNFGQEDWGWHEVALLLPLVAVDSTGMVVPGASMPVVIDTPIPGAKWQFIYDALLHVNSAAPQLPIKMRLGAAYVSGYRFELVASGDADLATSKATRQVL